MDRFSNEIGWNSLSHSSLYAHSCPSSPRSSLLKIYPALYIFRLKLFFKTVSKFEYNRLFLRDHNFQSIFTAPWTRFPVCESDVTRYPH